MQKNLLKHLLLIGTFVVSITNSNAQELTIGVEPFPPVFDESGQGLGTDLLNTIAKNSDLSFKIQVMTYARAKKELKNERLDIIGLIPKGLETEDFYRYGLELDWSFDNHVDIYSTDTKYLTIDEIPVDSLGTLAGNADFFSEALNIPIDTFVEVASLEQLVKMLEKKRLKAIVFERIATMSSIQKYLQQTIYYRFLESMPATLAVTNTDRGRQLKQVLDTEILKIAAKKTFKRFGNYNTLPPQGEVPYIISPSNDKVTTLLNNQ
jgi:polar amino acid transport system substrate-binding protein